jgi:hypothetical protein
VLQVQRVCGFVEDECRSLSDERQSDRQALPLPARKVLTALSDQGIILLRQGFDELGCPGFDRRLPNLVEGRVPASVGDILCDRSGEEWAALRNSA